jgi:hypothetical protein
MGGIIDEMHILIDRITENDSRYFPHYDESFILFLMIHFNAVNVIEIEIKKAYQFSIKDFIHILKSDWSEVQTKEKIILSHILKKKGYTKIRYEVKFPGGRCDTYAIHPKTNTKIVGECCTCGLKKVRKTLENPNNELWHLRSDLKLYIYRRGDNWTEFAKRMNNLEKLRRKNLHNLMMEADEEIN